MGRCGASFWSPSVLAAAIFGSCLWLVDQVLNDTPSSNLLAALFYGFAMGMMEMFLERRRRRRGGPDA